MKRMNKEIIIEKIKNTKEHIRCALTMFYFLFFYLLINGIQGNFILLLGATATAIESSYLTCIRLPRLHYMLKMEE